jgi:UDP-N-acetylglucosamine 2-epimerase (non-hydrolysing)
MIIFVYGTTAEAIKIAPVVRRLEAQGIRYEQWVTMQHTDSLVAILPVLGLPEPDRIIANGNKGQPLKSSRDVVGWLWEIHRWMRREIKPLKAELPSNTVIVVHGDTLTTVVGAWLARKLGVASAHIEGGLRSGNWRHPFPEELDRRIVGKLASVHYPPSEEAFRHLEGKKNVVHTFGNTVIDAVIDQGHDASESGELFGIVLLHRFEFISNQSLVNETVAALAANSDVPLRLMVDAYSEGALANAIEEFGGGRFEPQQKLNHPEFIGLLKSAAFVVTDSGGIQAETALLGVPTLIHRKATEQHEGVGDNILLSEWKTERLADFVANYVTYKKPMRTPKVSPSDVIVKDLIDRGYATESEPQDGA